MELDRSRPDIYQRTFEQWLEVIEGENRLAIERFMAVEANREAVMTNPGSREAHHAWEGGYQEHIRQTMMIAAHNYKLIEHTGLLAELPLEEQFTLSDALTMMFLHDIEKPFMYGVQSDGFVVKTATMTKADRKQFRQAIIDEYGFVITDTMVNALLHVEGVRDKYYVPGERADQPLAALCHAADNLSARAFYDHRRPL